MDPNENKEMNPVMGEEAYEAPQQPQSGNAQQPSEPLRQDDPAAAQEQPQYIQSNPYAGQTGAGQEQSGAYHGAGTGKKESPYANSPYYGYHESRQSGQQQYQQQYQQPQGAVDDQQKKPRKKMGRNAKRAIAAAVAVVVVAGSCGATALAVNSHWKNQQQSLYDDLTGKISQLEQELKRVGGVTGSASVSGSPVSADGSLTPSQVYAKNVNSVVAISNQSTTNVWGQVTETASSGSGFVLTEDGYIISNYHVVEGANQLSVMTYLGDEYPAKLIGYDAMNDVSLLKVEAEGLEPVQIGKSEDLIVGDQVVAIGNPLGELTSSLTVGYISAKDRTINTDGNLINMMQTDAAINPGNSGGPLFNMKGEVVGITTAKFSGATSSGASIEGIGFAIPIDDVMNMISDLKEYGSIKNQAYLGVTVMDMDPKTAGMYSLPTGSYVQSVVPGGCAEKAGLQVKDIILSVGEHKVEGNATLTSALRKFRAGDTTTMKIFRGGQEMELTITFDEKPEQMPTEPQADAQQPQQEQPQQEQPRQPHGMDPFDFFFGRP